MITKEELLKVCSHKIYSSNDENQEAYIILYRLLRGETIEQAFTERCNTDNEFCALSNVCTNFSPYMCDEQCKFYVRPAYEISYNTASHDFSLYCGVIRVGIFQSYRDAMKYRDSLTEK